MHLDFDSLYSSFNKTLNSKLDSVLIIDGVSLRVLRSKDDGGFQMIFCSPWINVKLISSQFFLVPR